LIQIEFAEADIEEFKYWRFHHPDPLDWYNGEWKFFGLKVKEENIKKEQSKNP
jgi:hypothetical protein